jgi:hypothetical protein
MHLLSALFKTRRLLICLATILLVSLSACRVANEPSPIQWSKAEFAGIPEASHLNELSGLSRSNISSNLLWALNDGGNPSVVFAINTKAQIKARYQLEGVSNIDWEDITNYQFEDKNYLVIADTGDNTGKRSDLLLHIIEEPKQLIESGKIKPIRTIRFLWPDGARDVEAISADVARQQFLLISKKRVPAELYGLPFNAKDGDSPIFLATLEGIAQPNEKIMNTKGDVGRYRSQITGVDLSPDRRWLAVLNYQQIIFYPLTDGKLPKKLYPKQTLDLPWLPQAEAIAYSMDGNSLFVGSEQSPAPLIRFDRITTK